MDVNVDGISCWFIIIVIVIIVVGDDCDIF